MNNKRPWDVALTSENRLKVWARRATPDGHERHVRTFTRVGQRIQLYPWSEMKVGDFFVAPILGSKHALLTTFRQAAARRNMEVCIHPWTNKEGQPCFRVCMVQENIRQLKAKASRELGRKIPASDGKWAKRRKHHALVVAGRREADYTPPLVVAPGPPTEPPVDVGAGLVAEAGYNREERLREVQSRARAEMGLDPEEENYFEEISK